MRTHAGYERALARAAVVVAAVVVVAGAPPATAAGPADGFAGVTALGQGGTTGGAGGAVVTATTTAQFLDHIARPEPLVVQVRGTIALPTGTSDGMPPTT
ncbi:hypothetical protein SK854_42075 [Lentzea sp. BCCO 10_0061]|uniref:Uncharacterized protein n=1 Tax=Lentzea sokolovensis TaxID=3095429 RepID=A0ABU4VAH0_9PSEU|nr:hypothetical protein [Lentzea sp. BCCO 10_0061]MDX8148764.1 hypothetical protein [Lentzea sp. BCCO 10_0061]